jgi:transcription elongation factor Elf1
MRYNAEGEASMVCPECGEEDEDWLDVNSDGTVNCGACGCKFDSETGEEID